MRVVFLALAIVLSPAAAHADPALARAVRDTLAVCPDLFAGAPADAALEKIGFAPGLDATLVKTVGPAGRIEAPLDQFNSAYECAFEVIGSDAPSQDVLAGAAGWAGASAMGLVADREEASDAQGPYWTSVWRSRDPGRDWILTIEEYGPVAGEHVIARVFLAAQ